MFRTLKCVKDVEKITHIELFSINDVHYGNFCTKQKSHKVIIISGEIDINKTVLSSEKLFILDKHTDKFVQDDISISFFTITKDTEFTLFKIIDKLDDFLCQKINIEHDSKFVGNNSKLVYKRIHTVANSINIPIKNNDGDYKWYSNKDSDATTGNFNELELQMNSSKTINFAICPLFCFNKTSKTCWVSLKISQIMFEQKIENITDS